MHTVIVSDCLKFCDYRWLHCGCTVSCVLDIIHVSFHICWWTTVFGSRKCSSSKELGLL